MFLIMKMVPVRSVAALDNSTGSHGDTMLAQDHTTGDVWLKRNAGWVKIVSGGAVPAEAAVPLTGTATIKNSANSVTRAVALVAGVGNLAATDAIVANNDSLVLKKSDGATTSAGNATLNSPATAVVAAGVVSNVRAGA